MTLFNTILVPLDLHKKADNDIILTTAVDIAEKYGSKLIFVNVIDVDLDSTLVDRFNDVKAHYAINAERQLQKLVSGNVPAELNAEFKVVSGRSYSKVVAAADELGADLIIVAAHKKGMKEFLLGMTAARVVRHAECSVLVVRDD